MYRLKRITLLLKFLSKAIFYGPAKKCSIELKNIAVVPTGKLGDVVCMTPVLVSIRKNFPNARIVVAGPIKLHKPILADSGLVDDYVELDGEGAIENIKRQNIEAALITGPTFDALATLFLAGVSCIVSPTVTGGFSTAVTRPYRIALRFVETFNFRMREYAPRERLRVLEPFKIVENDISKKLGFSEQANIKVNAFFEDQQINLSNDLVIGITPTAGHKIKEWPEERFAEVIDHLTQKRNSKVIVIGGPNDKEKVGRTIGYLKTQSNVIEATHFNVDELKALVSKLKLFISVDTGPIYIAEAFNIPTIDITGPIDEKEQPPQGKFNRNVVPKERVAPELFVLNAKSYNREEALRQVMSITTAQAIEEIDKLINDLKIAGKA